LPIPFLNETDCKDRVDVDDVIASPGRLLKPGRKIADRPSAIADARSATRFADL
jgi:hypothetical protein